jgi:hypothetical protein
VASNTRASSGRPTQAKSRGASSAKSTAAAKRSSSSAKSKSPKASSAAKPPAAQPGGLERESLAHREVGRVGVAFLELVEREQRQWSGRSRDRHHRLGRSEGEHADHRGWRCGRGLIGGMVLGKRVLGPRRTVLGIPISRKGLSLQPVAKEVQKAGQQLGRLTDELAQARKQAKKVGNALS